MVNKVLDTAYAIKFLRILTQPWESMAAYKTGVIDSNGKRVVSVHDLTDKQKASYDKFDVLVWNLRRLMQKIPLGRSTIARYAAALKLIQEQTGGPVLECFSHYLKEHNYSQEIINEVNTTAGMDVGGIGALPITKRHPIDPGEADWIRAAAEKQRVKENDEEE